jgi:hypothetical protein
MCCEKENGMSSKMVVGVLALGLAGSALVAAPEQTYPGQPTQGHVMIDNRGPQQMIPVSVHQIAADASLRVQVLGTPSVTINGLVETRQARRNWEYQRLVAQPDRDIVPELNRLGAEGWETSLQIVTEANQVVVILKRPR